MLEYLKLTVVIYGCWRLW